MVQGVTPSMSFLKNKYKSSSKEDIMFGGKETKGRNLKRFKIHHLVNKKRGEEI